jgi:hypothetical protein
MKSTQCHISKSLEGLDFRKKYQLTKYVDSAKPLVVFGMYDDFDLEIVESCSSDVAIVWQGQDVMNATPNMINTIRDKGCINYTISHWGKSYLKEKGLFSIQEPISATIGVNKCIPMGSSVYFYTSNSSRESFDYYGGYMIEEIKERTKLKFHVCTLQTHNREQLEKVYEDCFINLRLTSFDGCPNTNLEIGMMGRPSVYNGDIPHSYKWRDVDDIVEIVIERYNKRHEDNSQIAKDIVKFTNSVNYIFKR